MKLFKTYSEKQVRKLEVIANKIEALASLYAPMTDEQLQGQTALFKQRLAAGETLDDLLPDAFAAMREACHRVLGLRPFHCQLLGGIILHQGRIAEMKTGEGKTLVATLPAYLNALTGRGVHIVTVNDYLARRDSEWMGQAYRFMGLSVGLIVHGLENDERKQAYACDITYGTNNEIGFDYLRDNMVIYREQMVQREHAFAIVDEVDSILIDEARTPLIISGTGAKSTDLYKRTNELVRRMKAVRIKEMDTKESYENTEYDYLVDEKARTAVLLPNGTRKAEAFFQIENLTDPEHTELAHHVHQAIRAHGVMHRDVDYVVKDGGVVIVDSFTGRLMPGRRYSEGLHQAIEAKENVRIEHESKTLATITFQNYFRLYDKLSGMTGTALTEQDEFREIYRLDVVEVPTNKPMIRKDLPDVVYKSEMGKFHAVIEQVVDCYQRGQPVLVGTVNIDKSEQLSKMLARRGVPHEVLNAKNHRKEAEIVAMAGKLNAVTISTNMAGRGTDIKLGGNPEFMARHTMEKEGYSDELLAEAAAYGVTDNQEILAARHRFGELVEAYKAEISEEAAKVAELGGLYIIGTERHESRRIDNQLRGRSGRQGDPGTSRFYLSLQDDLMRLFGSDRIMGLVETLGLEEDQPIEAKFLSNSIESAQRRVEGNNFERRKNVLNYDDVMNQQRALIYQQRREALSGMDLKEKILGMIARTAESLALQYCSAPDSAEWDWQGLAGSGAAAYMPAYELTAASAQGMDTAAMEERIRQRMLERHALSEEEFGCEGMRELERIVLLRMVDTKWMDHIDAMDDLRQGVSMQGYAQHNPLVAYRTEGSEMFDAMVDEIRQDTVRYLLSVRKKEEVRREQVAKVTSESGSVGGDASQERRPVRRGEKVGRNDPCPCGSGKKYKKCCGASADTEN
ncbi:MAG: preprotein translocase subunit SecA [Clostridia bacterium]|nr:preprotein translocase subunit SecA [Clostridia bacterium]